MRAHLCIGLLFAVSNGPVRDAVGLHTEDAKAIDAVYGTSLLQVGPLVLKSAVQHPSAPLLNSTRVNTTRNGSAVLRHTQQLLSDDSPWHRGRSGKGAPRAGDSGREPTKQWEPTKPWCVRYALRMSTICIVSIGIIVVILNKRKESLTVTAYKTDEDAENDEEVLWMVSTEDLVSEMGLSGLCFLDMGRVGLSGYPLLYTLPCLALQGFTLQAIFLGYLLNSLEPQPWSTPSIPLDAMVVAAVYVHFVNVCEELAFDLAKIIHLLTLHKSPSHKAMVSVITFIDVLVVPGATLIIGSLFLCTSSTASDLIVNSVGVAFITNIDNFIVQINTVSNKMVRTNQSTAVHFPTDRGYVKAVNWLVCVVPVIPAAFSLMMYHVGKHMMALG